ncbi:tartrate dehydrogenase [soil metagenome]
MSGGSTYRVAGIPGDGIGVEVLAAARTVLDHAAALHGFELAWTEFDWSCQRYLDTGAMMPPDGLDELRSHDAVFLGAVGYPGVPDHVSLWGLLIPIRRAFGQYVNLRPVRLLPGVRSPLAGRGPEDVDLVVVRENSEGEYSQIGGRHGQGAEEFAVQEAIFTRRGIERIARYAFELARGRRRRVCSATKSNGIVHTMPFWDEVVAGVAAEYPDVAYEQMHVDALAARMVLAPDRLDVVVGSNLFGDILSDLAAAVAGSLGVAPSGNINPSREFPSMFESVHGSAPDIAGQGIANPVAQILAGAMMLEHLGQTEAADAVRAAVDGVLAARQVLTADLGGTATTARMAETVCRLLVEESERPPSVRPSISASRPG